MIAVRLVARKSRAKTSTGRGKGKAKSHYVLVWQEPILDATGEPVRRANGKIKYRQFQESCGTTDSVSAKSARLKKWRELNGLEKPKEPEKHVTLDVLGDLDEGWLRNRDRAEGTIYLSKLAMRHLKEALKANGHSLNADAVMPQDIEAFITVRRGDVGAKSINNDLGALKATWNRAVKRGVLRENPFIRIEKLTVDPKPINPLTAAEEKALLEACADDLELEAYVRLASDTGCRAGELSNLRVKGLDLDNGLGRIECNTEWKSKTRRNRAIAFTPETAVVVKRWLLTRGCLPHVFKNEGDKARGHYHRIRARFNKAVENSDIKRKVTLHDLRRTVGSLLAERDINQRVAMEFLGHSNIATTARFYQSVRPETLRDAVARLRPTGTDHDTSGD